jgi:myosin heavy subunit
LEEEKESSTEGPSVENLREQLPFKEIDLKIESIQEHYGAIEKHLFEADERQNHHLVRLQQLELSREELLQKTRELWNQNNENKGFAQDQEGRMDFFEKERSEFSEKIVELEGQIAAQINAENDAWKLSKEEFESFHTKFEAFQKELTLGVSQALEQCQNIQFEHEKLESEKASLSDQEALQEANAKQVEQIEMMQSEIKELQSQNAQFEEKVQSSQLGHEIMIDGVKVEMGSLDERIEGFKKKFEDEVEQKSQTLNKELVLARDSQYDQHQKVQKELDQVKQQQREIGNLKETLDSKEKETKELRHEIRVLKNEMGSLYQQLRQQRTVAFGAIAAAVFMSVGLSYVMISPAPVSTHHTLAMQDNQHFNEATIDLEAPEVEIVEVYEDSEANAQIENTDFFADSQAEEPIQAVQEPEVTPALDVVDPQPTNHVVSASYVDYVVKKGDNIYNIAKKHKGQGRLMERIERIQRDNKLQTPDIKPGQVLRISL